VDAATESAVVSVAGAAAVSEHPGVQPGSTVSEAGEVVAVSFKVVCADSGAVPVIV
jgi:hypothetical protein